jgi:predicted NBD/HSP70 family sugar kinase/biotin operon repressor
VRGDGSALRDHAQRTVLTELLRQGGASRKAIARTTGLSPATVTRAVDALRKEGVLRESAAVVSVQRGRREVRLELVAERDTVVGVDLGASNTRLVLCDLAAAPLVVHEHATPADLAPKALARWLLERTGELSAAAGRTARPAGLCVGLPGAVGRSRTVSNAPNLPQVEDPEFLSVLEAGAGCPVGIDNDADLALLGELRLGAARGADPAAIITIGTGLGAALAVGGTVLQGRHGLVGEFGQLPVGPFGTPLEHMVTGNGITRRAAEAGVDLHDPALLFSGDPAYATLRRQFDDALQIVLTAVAVSVEPETIVVGGRIGAAIASDLPTYQAALAAGLRASPELVPGQLGDLSGALGAAVAAVRVLYVDLGVDPTHLGALPAVQEGRLLLDAAVAGSAQPRS